MLILRPSSSGLKRLINIQKCRSSTKLDNCALHGLYSISNSSEYERSFTVWRAVVGILHLIRSQFYIQLVCKALLSFTLGIKI